MTSGTASPVFHLPLSPRHRIAEIVSACPALAVISERLPEGQKRMAHERLLSELFQRLLHAPDLTYETARELLDHDAPADAVADEEMAWLLADPETNLLYEWWREIWEPQTDPELRRSARYYAGLLARLYRLERQLFVEGRKAAVV